MFNLGLALRQKYAKFLDYDTNSILAMSSKVLRCKKSLESTLKGFYDMTRDLSDGQRLAEKLRNNQIDDLPSGSGSSSVWQEVKLDEELVATLSYDTVKNSPYVMHHRSPVKDDLENYIEIKNLVGIKKLRRFINDHYGMDFKSKILTLLSTVQSELYFDRTRETIGYLDHLASWIDEPVYEMKEGSTTIKISMLELLDQVNLLSFIGMVDENMNYLITAPIVNALIGSQMVALNQPDSSQYLGRQQKSKGKLGNKSSTSGKFNSKKVLFYSSHDTILSVLLVDLGIINPIEGASFAKRLVAAKQSNATDLQKLTQGLTTCQYGVSAIFELWSIEAETGSEIAVVRLSLYNDSNPKAAKIDWVAQPLGTMCQRRFKQLYPNEPLFNYYPQGQDKNALNLNMDCPFELFKKIADHWKYDEVKYRKIFNDEL